MTAMPMPFARCTAATTAACAASSATPRSAASPPTTCASRARSTRSSPTGRSATRRLPPKRKVTTVRDVYVSTKDDLPVRVVDHAEIGNRAETIFDFVLAEQLPLNAQTRALLRMAPSPGARDVDEGPFR
jgi:hypothetical protein